jgi:hypothetical protein
VDSGAQTHVWPNPHTYVQGVSPRGQRDAQNLSQALGKMQEEVEAAERVPAVCDSTPRPGVLVVKLLGGSVDVRDAGGLGLLQGCVLLVEVLFDHFHRCGWILDVSLISACILGACLMGLGSVDVRDALYQYRRYI